METQAKRKKRWMVQRTQYLSGCPYLRLLQRKLFCDSLHSSIDALSSENQFCSSEVRTSHLNSRSTRDTELIFFTETGCGKTTVVQLLSTILQRQLKIVNCHATTETSDIIGGLRPVRRRNAISVDLRDKFRTLLSLVGESDLLENNAEVQKAVEIVGNAHPETGSDFPTIIVNATRELLEGHSPCSCETKGLDTKRRKKNEGSSHPVTNSECSIFQAATEIEKLFRSSASLFEWADGPLIETMREGHMFLLDEMSLAEDAVLERLNSVLEPSRTMVLAERGDDGMGEDGYIVRADPNFLMFATMNPGGDFGKRELSPALRSRFTEIWVPGVTDLCDIKMVLDTTLTRLDTQDDNHQVVKCILDYIQWFNSKICGDPSSVCSGLVLSLRDVIAWANFITQTAASGEGLELWESYCHGAALMHLDGLGLGTGFSTADAQRTRERAFSFLLAQVPSKFRLVCESSTKEAEFTKVESQGRFGIHPFSIQMGPKPNPDSDFAFHAKTTASNLLRVLRAMQLKKPILLEGSPGVGKTR